jgi:predicted SpoU family rRNA methylase
MENTNNIKTALSNTGINCDGLIITKDIKKIIISAMFEGIERSAGYFETDFDELINDFVKGKNIKNYKISIEDIKNHIKRIHENILVLELLIND